MDLAAPKGIYRVNTLARLNVCERINTPLAQAELEEFRERFGRPARPLRSITGPGSSSWCTPASGLSRSWKTRRLPIPMSGMR